MMLKKIIRILKNDKKPLISDDFAAKHWNIIIRERLIQLVRALFLRVFTIFRVPFLFVGKGIHIRNVANLDAGKGLMIGDYCKIDCLSEKKCVFGKNVSINRNVEIASSPTIESLGKGFKIGNRVGINSGCFFGAQGGIEILDGTIIGPHVLIFSENHRFDRDMSILKSGLKREKVKIGKDCWIGAGVKIMPGVEIGDHCIIAAGSIVTKSFGSNSFIAGVPAEIKKSIDKKIQDEDYLN
tara:strand:+ start:7630 stop:8349 length:720 start_codon:yes stop_codon:yes gene_type:complete